MTPIPTLCNYCKHTTGWIDCKPDEEGWIGSKLTCTAFPEGRPDDIALDEFLHFEKHPEQKNDIVFEHEENFTQTPPVPFEFYKNAYETQKIEQLIREGKAVLATDTKPLPLP